jgi:hypothetical protein
MGSRAGAGSLFEAGPGTLELQLRISFTASYLRGGRLIQDWLR